MGIGINGRIAEELRNDSFTSNPEIIVAEIVELPAPM